MGCGGWGAPDGLVPGEGWQHEGSQWYIGPQGPPQCHTVTFSGYFRGCPRKEAVEAGRVEGSLGRVWSSV